MFAGGDLIDYEPVLKNIEESVKKISETVDSIMTDSDEKDLSVVQRIRYDLFVAYTLNSFLWKYLRMEGCAPPPSLVSNMNSVRELMTELQTEIDKHLMPKINVQAAARIVRHELWEPSDKKETSMDTDG